MSTTRLEETVCDSYSDYFNNKGGDASSVLPVLDQTEAISGLDDDILKIKIGICAMNKKTKAPPMREILNRMARTEIFEFIMFSDDTIKNEPVEAWPICDCLISFYSNGFPLDKAIAYTKLREPLVLNDLEMQYDLLDRRRVYELLKSAGIETPRNAVLNRNMSSELGSVAELIESEDAVQIGDTFFHKPFVEKPVDAEDHNVYIYYPSSAGGGSQRLFRKVGSRSSVYSSESTVRRTGSYLYEEFVPTDGTDVKVYTVGPEYAHAEARKSPSLDGKVERDSQGKEIRYPVILNQYEKEIAKKVCELFKQTVCGFDLLRTHGKSYVCDVNGFSFVKTSKKYYDDCAQVLASLILQTLAPQLNMPYNLDMPDDTPMAEANNGSMLELRCVIGVIRHGDRTPKQKMKMEVRNQKFIDLFSKHEGFKERKLKLKRPKQLQEVLDIARELLNDIKEDRAVFESPNKLHQLKSVLEMYGHFSGINRKIQLKYFGRAKPSHESSGQESGKEEKTDRAEKIEKEKESNDSPTLLLILKWGGELTSAGKAQAEELGRAFRCMYPGGQGEYAAFPGCGLLRLHSTYRHDLKIYASDEGRVQMTAAAFAKGFLALEGELTPILVHLVRSDKNTTEMLDTSTDAARIMSNRVKVRLHDILHKDRDFSVDDKEKLSPLQASSLLKAMKTVQNPHKMCTQLYSHVQSLVSQLKEKLNSKEYDPKEPFLYHGETLELMTHRWTKLAKDFKLRSGQFDISLIPDLYDCIKYDFQHNGKLGLHDTYELFECAKALADIVIPQEYGITREEKLSISQRVCTRLLRKIHGDLKHADQSHATTRLNPKYSRGVVTPHRHVRTRLYFTSESHIHTVINTLRCGKLFSDAVDEQWRRAIDFLGEVPELNYMTQIVLMLYEDPKADVQSEQRFHIELHFSPGARTVDDPYYRGSPRRNKSEPSYFNSAPPSVERSNRELESLTKRIENKTTRSSSDSQCAVQTSKSVVTAFADGIYHSDAGILRSSTKKPTTAVTNSRRVAFCPISSTNFRELSAALPTEQSYDLHAFDDKFYSGNEQPRSTIGGNFVDLDESEETGTSGTEEQSTESSSISVNITEESLGGALPTANSNLSAGSDLVHKNPQCCDKGSERALNIGAAGVKSCDDEVTNKNEETIPTRSASDSLVSLDAKKVVQRCLFNENQNETRNRDQLVGETFQVTKSDSDLRELKDSLPPQGLEQEVICTQVGSSPTQSSTSHLQGISYPELRNMESSDMLEKVEVFQSKDKSSLQSSPVDIPQLPKPNQEKDEVAHSSSYPGTETLSRRWKKEEKQYPVDRDEQNQGKPSSAKSDSGTSHHTAYKFGEGLHVKSCSEADLQTNSLTSITWPQSLFTSRQSPLRHSLGQVSSLPAIRAVRNLKLTLQSNLVVRPLKSRPGSSSSEVNTSQPPVADFWDESITTVASLNPLQTLHNCIPLKQMELYLEALTENVPDYTPSKTPKRNPSKKLALKQTPQKQMRSLEEQASLDLGKLSDPSSSSS